MSRSWLPAIAAALVLAPACARDKPKQAQESALHYQIGQGFLSRGETARALSELFKARDLNPKDPEVHNLLGLAYVQYGDRSEAEKSFRKAVALDPEYSDAFNHLCALQIDKGLYDEAIASCTKALQNVTYATPERAYHNMGLAYEKKGDLPKAVESYRKGLLHNRSFVLSRKSLGDIYSERRHYSEAAAEFEAARQACQASPKDAWGPACGESYYKLGMAYVKLKKRASAVEVFSECAKEHGEGEYGEKCRSNLKILK